MAKIRTATLKLCTTSQSTRPSDLTPLSAMPLRRPLGRIQRSAADFEDATDSCSSTCTSEPSSPLLQRRAKGPLRLKIGSADDATDAERIRLRELRNKQGVIFGELYAMGETSLGSGSFCFVRIARDMTTGTTVAAKSMDSSDVERRSVVQKEYEMLRRLSHPNIVAARDYFTSCDRVVLVLEYVSGSSLKRALQKEKQGRFCEDLSRSLFRALIGAIAYLHSVQVVHRDVKDENVIVSRRNRDLKLIDFNSACWRSPDRPEPLTPVAGTSLWADPEVLGGGACQSQKSDVWASGLCLHQMLTGVLPAPHRRALAVDSEQQFQVGTDEFMAQLMQLQTSALDAQCAQWAEVSQPGRELASRCLTLKAAARPTAEEVQQDGWLEIDT
eukprot:TRINITY_DN21580_c0_g1_i1.p1 TRINITY_DN21580_c0_g1~~TRINITY_DN21580_c0_g1_i1.p1  ORF type:complete len:434 (-),score=81.99 TRINITY_DN21580_c0_g1_i1:106-1263(-)